ncbi:MAG: response regulator [Campylobacterota bacterium]
MAATNLKIAVVDDENEILNILEKFLKKKGHNVRTFSNPVVAKDQIDSSYDVVLLDIMMPQMSGLELLKILNQKNKNCKVVMMTAYSTLDKVLESHREGAKYYLMKPFKSLQEVQDKIDEVMKK